MKMKIAVSGSRGQIGRRLVALGAIPLECNILDKAQIASELDRVQPDVIIHAAAISSIDECEKDYERALGVNVWGYNAVCEQAGDGKVILLSSDQVFDGAVGDYKEDDVPNPVNNYGLSKLGAEGVAQLYDNKIVRLSRGFSNRIDSDIYKYIEELRAGHEIHVPDFIHRNYCHLDYVSQNLMHYAAHVAEMPKILHIGGRFSLSFFSLMRLIAGQLRRESLVKPRTPAETKEESFSPRPLNCGFDVTLSRILLFSTPPPKQSVAHMMKEKPHAN